MTTEFPVTDFTVPITRAAGLWAWMCGIKMQAMSAITAQACSNDFVTQDRPIGILINSIMCGTKQGVKNCQTRVKVVWE
jgi:hypothetical protein